MEPLKLKADITHVDCVIIQQAENFKRVIELFQLHFLHFLASHFFGSLSSGVDLSKNSLAARSCNVPPHFSPRD